MRTSISDPIRICGVRVPEIEGVIGITLCPGKRDGDKWDRDLDADLDDIQTWGARAIVTLIEDHEFDMLCVRGLGGAVRERGMDWYHLPIRDVSIPDDRFEAAWKTAGPLLEERLRASERIVVHCRGGLGRAGMVAALLLRELGLESEAAIRVVRAARLGAIETIEQERYVRWRALNASPACP